MGQKTVVWFTHLLRNWIGFSHQDGHLDYVNLFLKFFVLPVILSYSTVIILLLVAHFLGLISYIYKKMNNVPDDILSNSWHKLRNFIFNCFIKLGKMYHDYEIKGMEHVPEGPGLIIFYHGTVVFDYFLFIAHMYVQKRKICIGVADRSLFSLPGLRPYLQFLPCIPGSKAECIEMLNKGHLVAIAPGGGREGMFSDEYYNLFWGKRVGFAQVALEAKVPIIPMFTQNIQEAFRGFGRRCLLRWLYEKTRRIAVPIYGYFPVKLCTYLGEPIPYDPNITAMELAEKTKMAIENLRDQHEKIPGKILRAISERFDKHHKDD